MQYSVTIRGHIRIVSYLVPSIIVLKVPLEVGTPTNIVIIRYMINETYGGFQINLDALDGVLDDREQRGLQISNSVRLSSYIARNAIVLVHNCSIESTLYLFLQQCYILIMYRRPY